MNEKAQENIRLFNELREFSTRDIPPDVSASAAHHRGRITPECLKPYDLLRYSSPAELPPSIRAHVDSCSSCRTLLLPRIDPDLIEHIIEEVPAPTSVASERTVDATHWYGYPKRWAAAAGRKLVVAASRLKKLVRRGEPKQDAKIPVPN